MPMAQEAAPEQARNIDCDAAMSSVPHMSHVCSINCTHGGLWNHARNADCKQPQGTYWHCNSFRQCRSECHFKDHQCEVSQS